MNVSVVIPNLNGAKYLGDCIDSLLTQSVKCKIIVVDNASTDNSIQLLEAYGQKVTVLPQTRNLGFAGGVNVGIKHALEDKADYIAVFNNDAVAEKDWAKSLIDTLVTNQNCAIATSKILQLNKNLFDAVGTCYSIFGAPFSRGRNEKDNGQYDQEELVFGGSGCASMYKAELFNKIGLFDEDFFAYYEEDDVNFRAHLADYQVITAPKSVVHHRVGSTSSKIKGFTTYHRSKNFWYLYTKNMPGFLFYKYLPLASFWYLLMFIKHTRTGNFVPFVKGFGVCIMHIPKTFAKRRLIQKSRKSSVKDIDTLLFHGIPPKNIRKPQ